MPKSYLNKNEKNMLIHIICFWDYIENFVKPHFNSNLFSSTEKWQIKVASTYIKKTVFSVLDNVDHSSIKSIMHVAKNHTLELLPHKHFVDNINKILNDKYSIETLSEAALFKCIYACNGNNLNCELFKLLQSYSIPTFDSSNPNTCPYKINTYNLPKEVNTNVNQ